VPAFATLCLCRLSQEAATAADHTLQLEHIKALAAARQEGQQQVQDAQQSWREQRATLEKQHLQAMLRSKQVQEQERLQWQKERDELVQQLTAQYTASGLQVCLSATSTRSANDLIAIASSVSFAALQ
jgi:hypothetical protein